MPAPAIIHRAIGQLNSKRFPADVIESLETLCESMQRTADRLIALEVVLDQVDQQSIVIKNAVEHFRGPIKDAFQTWPYRTDTVSSGGKPPCQVVDTSRSKLELLRIESIEKQQDTKTIIDRYALLGSIRGVIDAMTCTRKKMQEVNWETLTVPRF